MMKTERKEIDPFDYMRQNLAAGATVGFDEAQVPWKTWEALKGV